VARIGEKRNVYRLVVGKPEGKRPLGRQRRRWVDNIKLGLLEVGFGVEWIGLAQDRYRNYRGAAQLVASRVVLSSTELLVKGRRS
jgi:hypothetical protein